MMWYEEAELWGVLMLEKWLQDKRENWFLPVATIGGHRQTRPPATHKEDLTRPELPRTLTSDYTAWDLLRSKPCWKSLPLGFVRVAQLKWLTHKQGHTALQEATLTGVCASPLLWEPLQQ